MIESGTLSAEHVENVLARLNAASPPECVETILELKEAPAPARHTWPTAIAAAGIAAMGKQVRFYSTVDLVNLLEREKREARLACYLPFSQAGGALPFHLLSKLYEDTSVASRPI